MDAQALTASKKTHSGEHATPKQVKVAFHVRRRDCTIEEASCEPIILFPGTHGNEGTEVDVVAHGRK